VLSEYQVSTEFVLSKFALRLRKRQLKVLFCGEMAAARRRSYKQALVLRYP